MLSALKRLKLNRDKPELKLCSGLVNTCQAHPQWFQSTSIVDIIYSTISPKKGSTIADMKAKLLQNNSPLPSFLISLLTVAYGHVQSWPVEFVQVK